MVQESSPLTPYVVGGTSRPWFYGEKGGYCSGSWFRYQQYFRRVLQSVSTLGFESVHTVVSSRGISRQIKRPFNARFGPRPGAQK